MDEIMTKPKKSSEPGHAPTAGQGGEPHQTTSEQPLTTNQGLPIADNQNTLTVGPRGPQLLEDFILREKITHFDHERIPERVVHARGYAAHGYFEAYEGNEDLTCAEFLQAGARTEVFTRFSTVAGNKGSFDTARDVRGFSVKFYTTQGNYDLVGNNIPVFFIQDAMKFPDLVHSVKPEPDRGFPQAQSAHDTFWDFVSLTPESTHMLMWVMSDRGIPRSFRMMEGFGVHTFRLINAQGESKFVKFHWRPKLGTFSLVWDEAVKIAGADPDFHRRDLWDSIEQGDYPEWELCVQTLTQAEADALDYDVLDPTKLIPEEDFPLRAVGRMVLDRNVDNFFAETEQVAFCPSHLVPGIDFSNDPLLQGRLFSYLDTQLKRLGGPNFHQIPINRPRCPFANFQRDAHMQTHVPKGRTNYEPNSLDGGSPRECPERGFTSFAAKESGEKQRIRPESFADHYSQARLFWKSMTPPEQRHIIAAFGFELSKCDHEHVRERMVANLHNVDTELAEGVAKEIGMEHKIEASRAASAPFDMPASPALSQYTKAPESLMGKKLGVLLTEGSPAKLVDALKAAAKKEGASVAIVGLSRGAIKLDDGQELAPDHFIDGAPSVLFDAIVLAPGEGAMQELERKPAAVNWIRDAFAHLKTIGWIARTRPLFEKASVQQHLESDAAIVALDDASVEAFIESAKGHRNWDRESEMA